MEIHRRESALSSSGFGSGYLIDQIHVLTARHVIAESEEVVDCERLSARILGDSLEPSDFEALATLVWEDESLDLAILALSRPYRDAFERPRFGRLEAQDPVDCHAIGFPKATEVENNGKISRDTMRLSCTTNQGSYAKATRKLFTLKSDSAKPIGIEGWKGMSGASLFASAGNEQVLIGVITDTPRALEHSSLKYIPISLAVDQPNFPQKLMSAGEYVQIQQDSNGFKKHSIFRRPKIGSKPSIIRAAGVPLDTKLPSPVNICMVVGLTRRASVAVTVGFQAEELLSKFRSLEEASGQNLGIFHPPRRWENYENVRKGSLPGAIGCVCNAPNNNHLPEMLRNIFLGSHEACGSSAVFTFPIGAEEEARNLAAKIATLDSTKKQTPQTRTPIFLWTRAVPSQSRPRPGTLNEQLVEELDKLGNKSANKLWRRVTPEALRVWELGIMTRQSEVGPSAVDVETALSMLRSSPENESLRSGLSFAAINERFLQAIAGADRETRLALGVLSEEEATEPNPYWRYLAECHEPIRRGLFRIHQH